MVTLQVGKTLDGEFPTVIFAVLLSNLQMSLRHWPPLPLALIWPVKKIKSLINYEVSLADDNHKEITNKQKRKKDSLREKHQETLSTKPLQLLDYGLFIYLYIFFFDNVIWNGKI